MQTVNFLVVGLLYLLLAVGLWRAPRPVVGTRLGPILVAVAAVGLLGAGVFVTDPVSGYPPGTPNLAAEYSMSGALHDLLSVLTFLGLPVAMLVFARWFLRHGNRFWALYSLVSALAFLVSFGLASAAFNQAPSLVAFGGLFQRVTVITGFAWLTALAVHTYRETAGNPLL
jgi:hypothetical protein